MNKSRFAQNLVVILLIWAFFAQLTFGSRHLSMTSDEPAHMTAGYVFLTTGDSWAAPLHGHPPLLNAWAAWPILLQPERPDPYTVPFWRGEEFSDYIRATWPLLGPIERLTFVTRFPMMLLAVVLMALVYRWACDWFGHWGGVLAVAIMTWDPTMVAHSQLNTTDIGTTLFAFACLYLLNRLLQGSTRVWWLSMGIGLLLGATMASKGSGVILAPIVMILLIWGYLHEAGPGWWALLRKHPDPSASSRALLRAGSRWLGYASLAMLVSVLALWCIYRFEWGTLGGTSQLVPLATHIRMLQVIFEEKARLSFLWGERIQGGQWWYFPFAFAVKTPIPLIIALATAFVTRIRHGWRWLREEIALWFFPLVYVATAIYSELNIGYRHLLPAFPFIYVSLGCLANGLFQPQSRRQLVARWAGFALGAWYIVGTMQVYPFALAYFNEFVGGPRYGYRYLVDSNLDWGQSFKALKTYMDTAAIKRVWLSYYTYIDPAVYGVNYRPLYPAPNTEPVLIGRFDPPPRVYTISATTLQGIMSFPDLYDWFRHQEPTAQPGYGLLVYRVNPPDRPGRWVAQCTAPQPPMTPQIIEEGFGRNDLRQVLFDCTNSWIYPEGGRSSGWYVFHRDTWQHADDFLRKQLTPTRLTYQQTWYYDEPPFAVFQSNGSDTPPSPWASASVRVAPSAWSPARVVTETSVRTPPVRFSGPLTFLGYQLLSAPAQHLELATAWRVEDTPTRPLALTARLITAEGTSVASADGLGVPIDQWQAGDILVQRHQWQTPGGLLRSSYWIQVSVHWQDTQERWQALVDGSAAGDQLLLAPSEAPQP